MSLNFTLGFKQSAFVRLLVTLAFFVLGTVSILAIENLSANNSRDTFSSADIDLSIIPDQDVYLRLETTFPIDSYSIIFDQTELPVREEGEDLVWKLDSITPNSELFVSMQSGNFFSESSEALRVVLETDDQTYEATIWGEGDLTRSDSIQDWFPEL